jgi:predicted kinase
MWTTLLIGGHSGAGKSTLARQLAQSTGAELRSMREFSSNDLSESDWLLERLSTWDGTPEDVVRVLQQAGADFAPALESIVHSSLNRGDARTIIEGERIRPNVAAELIEQAGPSLAAIFLIEPNAPIILKNLQSRSYRFRALSKPQQDNVIKVTDLYGHWLESEAGQVGLPVIHPQPWTTLFMRAGQALRFDQSSSRSSPQRA